MKQQLIAGCIALAAGLGAGQASAASYGATADTSVYQFLPQGNLSAYGNPSWVNTQYILNTGTGHGVVTLLDFNTLDSALSSLTPGSFTATLNLNLTSAAGSGFPTVNPTTSAPVSANVLSITSAWSEAGVISYAGLTSGGTYGNATATSGSGVLTFDITSLVEAWAAADSTGNGLMLSNMAYAVVGGSGAYGSIAFLSRETGFGAYIDVQMNPVPLPAALPLFASGIAGLGLLHWRRRRKSASHPVAAA